MSYDLYLYRRNKAPLLTSEVWETLKSRIQPDISQVEHQLIYDNETTGVYFILNKNKPTREQEDIEPFDNFEGFDTLNINLSINFLRPDYFGYETFKIFFSSLLDLDIYFLNLQEFDDRKHQPIKWTENEILSHWLVHNKLVAEQQFDELNLSFYNKEKSDAVWKYTSIKDELEASVGADIFVPNISFIQETATNQVYSFIVWSEAIPLFLPKVDMIIVLKKFKKFFKPIEETGITTYENVITEFGQNFESYNHPTCPNLLLLNQENAEKIRGKFNEMEVIGDYQTFGYQLGRDQFVNYK